MPAGAAEGLGRANTGAPQQISLAAQDGQEAAAVRCGAAAPTNRQGSGVCNRQHSSTATIS